MLIYPAIDLYQGKAVRLYKGDYAQMTVYSDDPPSIAEDFARQGATHMHIVDLEGAKSGETPNFVLTYLPKFDTSGNPSCMAISFTDRSECSSKYSMRLMSMLSMSSLAVCPLHNLHTWVRYLGVTFSSVA